MRPVSGSALTIFKPCIVIANLASGDRREFCFRHFSAGTARVFFADADERGFHREFFFRHGAVGEQQIFFADAAVR